MAEGLAATGEENPRVAHFIVGFVVFVGACAQRYGYGILAAFRGCSVAKWDFFGAVAFIFITQNKREERRRF